MTALGTFKLATCLAGGSALLVAGLVVVPGTSGAVRIAGSPPAVPSPADAATVSLADPTSKMRFKSPPNIVLILVDDMSLSDLASMPNVKTLLGDAGTTFDRTLSSYPLCCPARATILSGQYAHNHKVLGNEPPLGGFARFRDRQTLPVWLQKAGYRTTMVGKYLNRYDQKPHYVPPGWNGWGALNKRVYNYMDWKINRNGTTVAYPNVYQTDGLASLAAKRIRLAAPKSKPFFLWTSFMSPHNGSPRDVDDTVGGSPYVAERHRDAYAGQEPTRGPSFNEADISDKPSHIQGKTDVSLEQADELWQQRQEALMSVDEGVARIVAQLKASRELGNTVIAFTSDNGFLIGEHRLLGKILPYEESVRVPLLIRGPGFPAGLHVRQQTSLADLTPTFLKAAGGRATKTLDGVALQGLAANPKAWARRPILVEASPSAAQLANGAPTDRKKRWYVGVRTASNQLYVRYATGDREYYDMRSDPWQVRNSYGRPSSQAEVDRLDRLLTALRNCAGATCRRPLTG